MILQLIVYGHLPDLWSIAGSCLITAWAAVILLRTWHKSRLEQRAAAAAAASLVSEQEQSVSSVSSVEEDESATRTGAKPSPTNNNGIANVSLHANDVTIADDARHNEDITTKS
jgi:hypothetical protein